MKVLISLTDQSFQRTKSMGIFNVSMGLTKGLMNNPMVSELHILGNEECREAFADVPAHVHVHLTDKAVPRRFARVWWDQIGLCRAIRKIAPDWAILPKGFPPFFPRLGKTKLACYVHDVGWEYYENRPVAERKAAFPTHELLYFRRLSLHAMKISDLVLTHTQFNADRIRHYCPSAEVARIGIGFDAPSPTPVPFEERCAVLTYASTFPHKRMDLVFGRIENWLKQRQDRANIQVHIVGNLPCGCTLPSSNWIHHQRMPLAQLLEITRTKCRMVAYISDYESFGMPPVESMLNGVACITSDLPGPRENVPSQYLFKNEDERGFIETANAVYDGTVPFTCPSFPTWEEVAQRCVVAMKKADAGC